MMLKNQWSSKAARSISQKKGQKYPQFHVATKIYWSPKKKCNLTIQNFFFTFFFHLRLKKLKVRLNQNGFMESSIFQKMTPKIWRISVLCTIKTLRAKILQIFRVIFWKIDDFINSFWLNLTFTLSTYSRSLVQIWIKFIIFKGQEISVDFILVINSSKKSPQKIASKMWQNQKSKSILFCAQN